MKLAIIAGDGDRARVREAMVSVAGVRKPAMTWVRGAFAATGESAAGLGGGRGCCHDAITLRGDR